MIEELFYQQKKMIEVEGPLRVWHCNKVPINQKKKVKYVPKLTPHLFSKKLFFRWYNTVTYY